jgi:predicted ArsR family transcriptional regulator
VILLARSRGGSNPVSLPVRVTGTARDDHCASRCSKKSQSWFYDWRVGPDSFEAGVARLGLLQDAVRAALYRYVAAQDHDVSRNEAAAAVGVQRGLAAFHLDKLADAGLLEVSFRRLGGRTGPGAGRPAKLYRRADREVAASVPPRAYDTAAALLAETVEQAGADLTLHTVARQMGEEAGQQRRADAAGGPADRGMITRALAELGYEPYPDGSVVWMRNCPFHALSERFPPLVCGMNHSFITGLLTGLGAQSCQAHLDPAPGRCCVAILSKNNRT